MFILFGKDKKPEEFNWEKYYADEVAKTIHLMEKYDVGTPEYAECLEHIEWLKDQMRKDNKPKRKINWEGIAAVLGVIVTGAGVAVQVRGQNIQMRGQDIQMDMARAAWENDKEMLLCNNKLWNMSQKIK